MGLNPYFNGKCNFVYYESYVLILVLVEFAPKRVQTYIHIPIVLILVLVEFAPHNEEFDPGSGTEVYANY